MLFWFELCTEIVADTCLLLVCRNMLKAVYCRCTADLKSKHGTQSCFKWIDNKLLFLHSCNCVVTWNIPARSMTPSLLKELTSDRGIDYRASDQWHWEGLEGHALSSEEDSNSGTLKAVLRFPFVSRGREGVENETYVLRFASFCELLRRPLIYINFVKVQPQHQSVANLTATHHNVYIRSLSCTGVFFETCKWLV